MSIKSKLCYIIYKSIAVHLPNSSAKISFGARKIRAYLASKFIAYAGKNINIQKNAIFSSDLKIGDNSGIGENSFVQPRVSIGKNVMMGPECFIYTKNHETSRVDIPMINQGYGEFRPVTIGDDVWIGSRVTILPGVTIGEGCVIGACAVVTKDVPPYSVAVGNPARVVKNRKDNQKDNI